MAKICCPVCSQRLVGRAEGFYCEYCKQEWADEEVMPLKGAHQREKKPTLWTITTDKPSQRRLFKGMK